MTNAENILQMVTLAGVGWVLIEVISHGKTISAIKQRLKDLPCSKCNTGKKTDNDNDYEE